jgi:hypothetical protein
LVDRALKICIGLRQQRELAEQAHALAGEVGLRQDAKRLGIHRDALRAAFAQWGLPALERRVGWQPSRFLADRGEAERAFANPRPEPQAAATGVVGRALSGCC